MKNKLAVLALAFIFAAPLAFADDVEHKDETTVDTSHNPITGSDTTTTKSVKHKKIAGRSQKVEVTEKVKRKKDGSVKKEVEVDADAETEATKE